jgi:hypothetical protein
MHAIGSNSGTHLSPAPPHGATNEGTTEAVVTSSGEVLVRQPDGSAHRIRGRELLGGEWRADDVEASALLPGNAEIATGQPRASVSSPQLTGSVPRLPSRDYTRAASGQVLPLK